MTLGIVTHKLQLMNGCVLGGRREEGEITRGGQQSRQEENKLVAVSVQDVGVKKEIGQEVVKRTEWASEVREGEKGIVYHPSI